MLAATFPTATLPTATLLGPSSSTTSAEAVHLVQAQEARRVEAFGDRLDVLLSSAQTGGALAVAFGTVPPHHGPPPHVHHREAEVMVVLEGALEFSAGAEVGRTWTRVAAGGAAFLPRGVAHTFRNPEDTATRTLIVALPGGFEEFFAGCAEVFAAAEQGASPDMAAILRVADAHGIEFLVPLGAPPAA
ncbi:hypothetical protein tb265_12730 [Gemmatimonadetes bacterium T265]|nr:hypothetical protein tb265_12730 [Gemmatimonadetes bacterium T265]